MKGVEEIKTDNMALSDKIIEFYRNLTPERSIPQGFEWLFPYKETETLSCVDQFYRKYFNDYNPRTILLGINPGRFGAGVTGISFTDPKILKDKCGIDNDFPKKNELSAVFVYEFIEAFGGIEAFYQKFFISSVCPLGFTRNGINCNYYDDKDLYQSVKPFIVDSLRQQLELGINRNIAFSLGKGTNYKYLQYLNDEFQFFKEIKPLPHPRWVMQYRRKDKEVHIQNIIKQLQVI